MNILTALGEFIASLFLEGGRAEEERKQAGPKGAAYSDALKREAMAYYERHHSYDGFDYAAFDAQYDAYYAAHGSADGFTYQEPGKS